VQRSRSAQEIVVATRSREDVQLERGGPVRAWERLSEYVLAAFAETV
jgi:hypothetical protein